MPDALDKYRSMRDFGKTPEPSGKKRSKGLTAPIYTIQKHDATRLHYDFRLEAEGVLKSWAVTRVPTLDPEVKRLAVETEDHPRDYAEFEGLIPEGEYGAGPVIVWDYGVYENLTEKAGRTIPVGEGQRHGHVKVWLQGLRLKGAFALSKFKEEGGKRHWMFVKVRDEEAREGEPDWDERSVLTGRSIDDILGGQRKPRAHVRKTDVLGVRRKVG